MKYEEGISNNDTCDSLTKFEAGSKSCRVVDVDRSNVVCADTRAFYELMKEKVKQRSIVLGLPGISDLILQAGFLVGHHYYEEPRLSKYKRDTFSVSAICPQPHDGLPHDVKLTLVSII